MSSLQYRFDNSANIPVVLGNGAFDQLFNLTGLRSGPHTLTLTETDMAGNIATSQFSIGVPFPTAPSLLRVEAASDSGVSASDGITQNKRPVITGQAEAGVTVQVFSGTQLLGQTSAGTNGVWRFTPSALADGLYSLTAKGGQHLG